MTTDTPPSSPSERRSPPAKGDPSPFSFLPIPITQLRNGNVIGNGTGFFMRPDGRDISFLVTNYHVLTCRNPTDPGLILPGYPDSPDAMSFSLMKRVGEKVVFHEVTIKGLANSTTEWLEHRQRDKGVDLVALKIEIEGDDVPIYLDRLPLSEDVPLEVGQDVFLLGYPFAHSFQGALPIWKRGSIASEPHVPIAGLPKILVDTASRPGMSGSPVFARERLEGTWLTAEEHRLDKAWEEGKAEPLDVVSALGKSPHESVRYSEFRFVGVYAGRIGLPDRDFQLGVVWSAEAVRDLFRTPVRARHPFPQG